MCILLELPGLLDGRRYAMNLIGSKGEFGRMYNSMTMCACTFRYFKSINHPSADGL